MLGYHQRKKHNKYIIFSRLVNPQTMSGDGHRRQPWLTDVDETTHRQWVESILTPSSTVGYRRWWNNPQTMSGDGHRRQPWVTDVDETMTENNISLF